MPFFVSFAVSTLFLVPSPVEVLLILSMDKVFLVFAPKTNSLSSVLADDVLHF